MSKINDWKTILTLGLTLCLLIFWGFHKVAQYKKNFQQAVSINEYDDINKINDNTNIGGDFSLKSIDGDWSLLKNAKNKFVILYFGYTFCPDICPTSLSKLTYILKALPTAQSDHIIPVFVSVDYIRDTPESVSTYSAYFSKKIIGLTGDKNDLDKITKQYATHYKLMYSALNKDNYSVDHSSYFYFINQKGKFISVISSSEDRQKILEKLTSYL